MFSYEELKARIEHEKICPLLASFEKRYVGGGTGEND